MAGLWAPFAVRRDGPASKYGYQGDIKGHKEGTVYHSAEGGLTVMMNLLESPGNTKSWTFSNPKVGRLLQHYAAEEHTWCNGSYDANRRFASCESEGRSGEILTPSQVDNLIELTVWLAEVFNWASLERRVTLWEHNEMVRFGSAPTSCPSGRIPWAVVIGKAREQMDLKADLEALRSECTALRSEYEAFKTFTIAVVQGQAAFDQYTTAVMRRHILDGHAQDSTTLFADMENARDDVHEAAEALD